jgi:hypothetical protein
MAILDDLKGILGDDAIAKIEANPAIKERLKKGNELYGLYLGEEEVEPGSADPKTTNTVTAPPPPPSTETKTTPGMFDLGAIERMLDKRFENLDTRISDTVNKAIETRGTEVVNNAARIATMRADELNRIYLRHTSITGEQFDTEKFNQFLEENKARGFRSVTEAYNEFIRPVEEEKRINTEVEKRTKAKSGEHVIGSTPQPSMNSNVRTIMKRTLAAAGEGSTAAQRAADRLNRMEADRAAAAS